MHKVPRPGNLQEGFSMHPYPCSRDSPAPGRSGTTAYRVPHPMPRGSPAANRGQAGKQLIIPSAWSLGTVTMATCTSTVHPASHTPVCCYKSSLPVHPGTTGLVEGECIRARPNQTPFPLAGWHQCTAGPAEPERILAQFTRQTQEQ